MIFGGSKIGYYLAKKLTELHIKVSIVERKAARCKYLSEALNDVLIIHGDGTDISLLEEEGLEHMDALLQVSSIITTTGYATVDFDLWPAFSKSILFLLMFVGGCAGSTGGGITSIRILVLLKKIKREIGKIFHPRAVMPIKNGDKTISEDTVSSISTFFSLYIFIFLISTVIISLEGIDLASAASSVAVTLGNVGPGFGFVGPRTTFSFFTPYSKLFFSFLMLLGRLELFTIIAFLAPKTWRNEI